MTIVENDDVTRGFELQDESGNPLDASLLFDYHIYVYKEGRFKELVAIYKKSNTGTFSIEVDAVETNLLWVVIPRYLTRDSAGCTFYGEVKVQLTATSAFINNKANDGVTDIELFYVLKSASQNSMQ